MKIAADEVNMNLFLHFYLFFTVSFFFIQFFFMLLHSPSISSLIPLLILLFFMCSLLRSTALWFAVAEDSTHIQIYIVAALRRETDTKVCVSFLQETGLP